MTLMTGTALGEFTTDLDTTTVVVDGVGALHSMKVCSTILYN